jgi:tRNA modification GTPase
VTAPATFVACLTPPGTAAIATLAVRGPDAWDSVRAICRLRNAEQGELPETAEASRFWLGRMTGDVADEVVVALQRLMPVPWVEIHCHGGQQLLRTLLDLFRSRGLQVCTWPELERWTANDPLQAAATVALAEARTTRTAAILLDQHHGALRGLLEEVVALLDAGDTNEAGHRLGAVQRHAALGQHLTTPWRVVIAGAPNVGKSSLVNALAGYQRSIVSPTPGTTRDAVGTLLAIDGWPVELSDTAGLHESAEGLERSGMAQAQAVIAGADVCLWVLDAASDPVWPPASLATPRLVISKLDLPAAWDLSRAAGAVPISARTGAGLETLCESLSRWLVPDPPPPGAPVAFTRALQEGVEAARAACQAGRTSEAQRVLRAIRNTTPPTDRDTPPAPE